MVVSWTGSAVLPRLRSFAASRPQARAFRGEETDLFHRITILGATGSIGTSNAEVLAQHPDRFEVAALVAGGDVRGLAGMARQMRAGFVALSDASKQTALREALAGSGIASGA